MLLHDIAFPLEIQFRSPYIPKYPLLSCATSLKSLPCAHLAETLDNRFEAIAVHLHPARLGSCFGAVPITALPGLLAGTSEEG